MTDLPRLTDGTVTLRPWGEGDAEAAVAGHDEVISHWLGQTSAPTVDDQRLLVAEWTAAREAGLPVAAYIVEHEGRAVGHVEITSAGSGGGTVAWSLFAGERGAGHATRAVRLLVDWALTDHGRGGLGLRRVEASVDAEHQDSLRVGTRAGLRREGVRRVAPGMGDRPMATEYVVMARLASDPPVTDPEGFRALLNSFLPRKRAISQMLVRDPEGRVLLCQLTYKQDWDLPGGVVEVGESPQLAVAREVEEELGLTIPAGTLLLTDWLPPWSGWDDALCLVFDGGTHQASVLDTIVRQTREIKDAAFCTLEEVTERCADFTARRVLSAIDNLDGAAPTYTESGR